MARRIVINNSGILVSKPGKDALSSNFANMMFDGSTKNSRVYLSGTLSSGGSAGHGLNYIPMFFVVVNGEQVPSVTMDEGSLTVTYPFDSTVAYVIFYDRWV